MYYSTYTPGYWVQVPHKPLLADMCIQCRHSFADHFEQFDGVTSGCNGRATNQQTAEGRGARITKHDRQQCRCDGFAMRYRKSWEWRASYPTYYSGSSYYYNNLIASSNSNALGVVEGTTTVSTNPPSNLASLNSAGTVSIDNSVQFKEGEIIKYRPDH